MKWPPTTKVGNLVTNQLLRSCTSAAPNYGEAQSAESRKDFIHKMKVCLKELRETQIWLKFGLKMRLSESPQMRVNIEECGELVAIFVRSIRTAQDKEGKR